MAARSKCRNLASTFAKRFANHIRSSSSPSNSSLHSYSSSWYDKEIDYQPVLVPDNVISSTSGGNSYWGPHPQTGVFGPAEKISSAKGGSGRCSNSSSSRESAACTSSVLKQTVWFRCTEDGDIEP